MDYVTNTTTEKLNSIGGMALVRNIRIFYAVFHLNSGSSPRLKDSMPSLGCCFYASFPLLLLTWMDLYGFR